MVRGKEYLQILKQKAEKKLADLSVNNNSDGLSELAHPAEEIQIYQIELELQNEELRRTHEELELVFERYYNLFNYAPVGYVVTDDVGIIRQANNTFYAMTGSPLTMAIERPFTDFIHEEDKTIFLLRYKAFFNHPEDKTLDIRLQNSNGKPVYVSIKGRSFKPDERGGKEVVRKREMLLSVTDISEIQQARLEAVKQKEIAEEANEAKRRIFTILAHDLRSPFHSVSSLINLLTSKDIELTDEIIGSCNSKVAEVMNLLDNLLKWGQSNSNAIIVQPSEVNLHDVVREMIQLYKSVADEKNIVLHYQCDIQNPITQIDRDLLQTVIRNIISNSIKYSYPHSKIEISITGGANDNTAVLSIRDYGVGMDEATMQFPENKPSVAGTAGEKGTGLGMRIIYGITKILPVEMQISSTKGAGTTIELHFTIERTA